MASIRDRTAAKLRVGEQLELWTSRELDAFGASLPWKGRRPRELTRSWDLFSDPRGLRGCGKDATLSAVPAGGLHAVPKSAPEVGSSEQLVLFVFSIEEV